MGILEHPPVQVWREAVKEDLSLKLYAPLYTSSGRKGRFDFERRQVMELKVIDVIHQEPDPHLFLITADLRPE